MEKVNRSTNYKIAMTGVFGALSVVLAITPIGYIAIPGTFISITVMHIPAILAVCTAGLVPGVGVGLIFGLTSLIKTAMSGGGANPFFLNPLVSVLPRALFPVVVWAVFKLLNLIPHFPKAVSGAIAAAFGTLSHTLMVMGAIYLLYGNILLSGMNAALSNFGFNALSLSGWQGFWAIIFCTLATNGVWEIIAATVLTAAVLGPLFAVQNKKSRITKLSEEDDDEESSEENDEKLSAPSEAEKTEITEITEERN